MGTCLFSLHLIFTRNNPCSSCARKLPAIASRKKGLGDGTTASRPARRIIAGSKDPLSQDHPILGPTIIRSSYMRSVHRGPGIRVECAQDDGDTISFRIRIRTEVLHYIVGYGYPLNIPGVLLTRPQTSVVLPGSQGKGEGPAEDRSFGALGEQK